MAELTAGEELLVAMTYPAVESELTVSFTASDREYLFYLDMDAMKLARCSLDRNPGKSNWVEDQGGLPQYICEIARSIHTKRGKSISNAIQIAVGVVKRWAKGVGDVDADTRAKAAKAVAQWEAKKAKARAKRASK